MLKIAQGLDLPFRVVASLAFPVPAFIRDFSYDQVCMPAADLCGLVLPAHSTSQAHFHLHAGCQQPLSGTHAAWRLQLWLCVLCRLLKSRLCRYLARLQPAGTQTHGSRSDLCHSRPAGHEASWTCSKCAVFMCADEELCPAGFKSCTSFLPHQDMPFELRQEVVDGQQFTG